jgi:large conductance mechanosensitive channel
MLQEFKKFAMRGNVVDLAVGVIIGAAFGRIVSSFVEHLVTPLMLKPALDAARLNDLENLTVFGSVKYGVFLSAVINFMIVAFVLFLLVKGINSVQKKQDAVAAPPPADIQLLTEIRDLLKNK